MNIVFVTNEFVTEPKSFDGGLSNYTFNIACAFLKKGNKVWVLVRSNLDESFEYKGLNVIRVSFKKNSLFKALDVLTRFKAEKFVSDLFQSFFFKKAIHSIDEDVDVIQYSNLHFGYFFKPNKGLVVGRMSSFLPAQVKEADNSYYDLLWLRIIIEKYWLKKRWKSIFAPSHKLVADIQRLTQKRIAVIESPYIGLTEDNWNYDTLNMIPFKEYGLFFGRLVELKGVLELSIALNTLFKEFPTFNFVFLGKDKAYENNLMSDIIKTNIDSEFYNRYIILPQQSKECLYPIVKSANFAVLPSRTENLSNAGIESLALGTLLIGTRDASFEQIIDDGYNGFLCEINNPDSIVHAVKKVLALTDNEKVQMSINAISTIKRMSGDKIATALISFYNKNL